MIKNKIKTFLINKKQNLFDFLIFLIFLIKKIKIY